MYRFDARFDSRCPHCGDEIWEGDSIGYIDDVIACDGCCDVHESEGN